MHQIKGTSRRGGGYEIGQSLYNKESVSNCIYRFPTEESLGSMNWTVSFWWKIYLFDDDKNKWLFVGNKSGDGALTDYNRSSFGVWDATQNNSSELNLFFNQRTDNAFSARITFAPLLVDPAAW